MKKIAAIVPSFITINEDVDDDCDDDKNENLNRIRCFFVEKKAPAH